MHYNMFIIAVCLLFLIKLNWPKTKDISIKKSHCSARFFSDASGEPETKEYSPLSIFDASGTDYELIFKADTPRLVKFSRDCP